MISTLSSVRTAETLRRTCEGGNGLLLLLRRKVAAGARREKLKYSIQYMDLDFMFKETCVN